MRPASEIPSVPTAAVLASGGVDSSILIHRMTYDYPRVVPLFIRSGMAWESVELIALRAFLAADPGEGVEDPVVLDLPLQSVYGEHWSITGQEVPAAGTPDESVYLPGRNLLFLGAASVYCASHGIEAIALGILRDNPFADSTLPFIQTYESCTRMALDWPLRILTPFSGSSKMQVMRRGRDLPLELTFSCLRPHGELHCGRCNKCSERRAAFQRAGIEDRTSYQGTCD